MMNLKIIKHDWISTALTLLLLGVPFLLAGLADYSGKYTGTTQEFQQVLTTQNVNVQNAGIKPNSQEELTLTAAVIAQVANPATGIYFTYRVGLDSLVGFGNSQVLYRLGNEVLKLTFLGSDPVVPRGEMPLPSTTNYFLAHNAAGSRAGLIDFGSLVYEDLYPGIDLVYGITGAGLKYEFRVAPGADPSQIVLEFANVDSLQVRTSEIQVFAGGEVLTDTGLVAFQGESRAAVPCAFLQVGPTAVQFQLGQYDASMPLIIDPELKFLGYSTYLGATGNDYGYGIAVENGYAYVTGETASNPFNTTGGAFDTTFNGGIDVFIAKLSADGSSLAYCTFLGGPGGDRARDIAVEGGFAYITGYTDSNQFNTTNGAFDTIYSGFNEAFVLKLAIDGASLVYSTYLGAEGNDYGNGIAVENGHAYVTGETSSNPFNTTGGAFDTTYGGGSLDAFVAKLSGDGASLSYCTYLGGGGDDFGNGITVEGGYAYVTGNTNSNPFNTTGGAFDTTYGGGLNDIFIAKLSGDGASLVFSTYLGAAGADWGLDIAVESGFAYIAGYTSSNPFNTTGGAYDRTFGGASDAFVAKLAADGASLDYCTYLGDTGSEYAESIAVEGGYAYIAGVTDSTLFNTTLGAFDTTQGGDVDAFVAKFSGNGASLAYCTFLGDTGADWARALAVEGGFVYITGLTSSASFNTTSGAFDRTFDGTSIDAFVAKFTTDTDIDGQPDDWETANGLNPAINDSFFDPDQDSLVNLQEYLQDTNPANPDTDGDGMNDGWEVAQTLDPLSNDATGDLDSDGLSNFQEFQCGTNATRDDTEGDGMDDGWEFLWALNPLANDTAGDLDADTLSNLQEFQLGTNPANPDTDGDGFSDGVEVADGKNPLDKTDFPSEVTQPWNLLDYILIVVAGIAIIFCVITIRIVRRISPFIKGDADKRKVA